MTTVQTPDDSSPETSPEHWEAILKADSLNRARNAEIDPYVDGGAKIDWFNRTESNEDIDSRLDRQVQGLSPHAATDNIGGRNRARITSR